MLTKVLIMNNCKNQNCIGGKVTCKSCNGTGKKARAKPNPPQIAPNQRPFPLFAGLPSDKCDTCNGIGMVNCKDCQGNSDAITWPSGI